MNKILIVDDECVIRTLLKLILSRQGFSVVSARNGSEAIRKFNRGDYNLVITDICMPVCDGNALASYVKSHKRSVPIVAYTGSSDKISSAFDQVLYKPALTNELIDVAHQFLSADEQVLSQRVNE